MVSHLPLSSLVPEAAPAFGSGPDLTRYLIVCAILVAGVAGLGWGFKRLLGRSLSLKAAQRSLRLVDLMPISGRHKLAVVRCYDRTFVLGLGEREVSLISELDPVIAAEDDPDTAQPDRNAFAQIVEHLRNQSAAPTNPTGRSLREGILG